MIEENEKKPGGQKNWLKEHDSIQVDLLKMKDDLIREDETIPEFEGINDAPEQPIYEEVLKTDPKPTPPKERIHPGMTIKQMLGMKKEQKPPAVKEKRDTTPPRLEEGTIPTSPELTSKIANVLQLENKLKRRKFELEKRSAMKDIPPPPKKPEGSEKKTVIDWEDEKVDEASEIGSDKLPDEPIPPPEMKKKKGEKQIHVPSESPYPNTTKEASGDAAEIENETIQGTAGTEPEKEEEVKKKKKGFLSFFSRNK